MQAEIWFWILMVLWFVLGGWANWPNHKAVGGNFLLFVIIGMLGWQVFGAAIK